MTNSCAGLANSSLSHFGFVESLGLFLGVVFSLSLLLLEDLFNIELVRDLFLVNWVSEGNHGDNDQDGATKNDQVVDSACL